MTTKTEEAIASVDPLVAEVVENLFFCEAEPLEDADLGPTDEWLWASIALHRPYRGRMTLAIPPEVATEFSLGVGEDDGDGARLLLLGELVNTLAGAFQASLASDDEDVGVGLPRTGIGVRWSEDATGVARVYDTGDGAFVLALEDEGDAAEELGDPKGLPAPDCAHVFDKAI
jgi:hypothetical protein